MRADDVNKPWLDDPRMTVMEKQMKAGTYVPIPESEMVTRAERKMMEQESSFSSERQSDGTAAPEPEFKEGADRRLPCTACSFLSSSECLVFEHSELLITRIIPNPTLRMVDWSAENPNQWKFDLGMMEVTLTSDAASHLFALLGLGDHPVIESWQQTQGESAQVPSPEHLQIDASHPYHDTETRRSEEPPPTDTSPPETIPPCGWRLV